MRVTPDIHRQALEIFTETYPSSDEETLSLLDRCGNNLALRREVESLLAAEAQSDDFIAEPLIRLPQPTSSEFEPGDSVGRYRLESVLGRGGMGTVYLATREEPGFELQVALKVVRSDRAQDGLLRRFLQEQEILAKLDHPNIVKPFDRGVTADGAPFLVMERVQGEPIDRYCSRLPIEERLKIFRKVCSAVHFAHQNLIVHRDLKPANVLVTAQGEPKILDFGIAQLEDSSPYSTRAETLRQTNSVFLGTLRYASPEQVRNADLITTSSDVYSLGVMLYELLAGRHPFEPWNQSFVDLGRAICEETPEKPSVVARQGETGTDDSDGKAEEESLGTVRPASFHREIAGDLDSIVLKAMSRETEDRYASAEKLAEDLGRHRDGLPVEAQESTWRYRLVKVLGKYSREVIGTVLLLLLVIASGLALFLWDQEKEAQQEKENAWAVADYFVKLFEVPQPVGTIEAKALLEKNAEKIEEAVRWAAEGEGNSGLQSQTMPDVSALLDSYGWAFFGLGEPKEAESWLAKAYGRRVQEPHDLGFVLTLIRLSAARDALGDLELASGNRAEAEQYRVEAAKNRSQAFELIRTQEFDDLWLVQWLNDTAYLLEDRGDFEAAEAISREVLEMKRRLLGDREISVAISYTNLGSILSRLGSYDEAVEVQRKALEIVTEVLGDEVVDGEHPDLVRYQNNLGVALRDLAWANGEPDDPAWAEAEELFGRSLRTRETEDLGASGAASVQNNWALLQMYRGQLRGDEELLTDSDIQLLEAHRVFVQEGQSRASGIVLRNRATLLQQLGRPEEAVDSARQALELLRGKNEYEWRQLDAESVLGGCLLDLGDLGEAEPLIRGSVEQLESKPTVPKANLEQARRRLEMLENRLAGS